MRLRIAIVPAGLLSFLRTHEMPGRLARIEEPTTSGEPFVLAVPLNRRRIGRDTRLLIDRPETTHADAALVGLLTRAYDLRDKLTQSGIASLSETARAAGINRTYLTRWARLAFVSPQITTAILEGRQPAHLTAVRLSRLTDTGYLLYLGCRRSRARIAGRRAYCHVVKAARKAIERPAPQGDAPKRASGDCCRELAPGGRHSVCLLVSADEDWPMKCRPTASQTAGEPGRPFGTAQEKKRKWLGDLDSNQGCPGQSREFYR
jgi:hypothetical protein